MANHNGNGNEPKRSAFRQRLAARASALPRERVDVPEWDMIGDNAAIVQAMTGTQRDAYEAEISGNKVSKDRRLNLVNFRARLIARCLIDPDTDALAYDYRDPRDIDEIGGFDAAGLDRIFKACQTLNGITDDDVEELTKNSPAEANGVSGLS